MMALLRDRKSRGKEILRRVEGEAKMIMKIGRKRERERGGSDAGGGGTGSRVKK